jgi:hypothetical protein
MTHHTSQPEIEEIVTALNDTSQCVCSLFELLTDLEKRGNPLVEPDMWRRRWTLSARSNPPFSRFSTVQRNRLGGT